MMRLDIVTPDQKVYSGNVTLVKVPGSKGSFEILHNHAPIISSLDKGEIKIIDEENNTIFFDIKGGLIEVKHNQITVLAKNLSQRT